MKKTVLAFVFISSALCSQTYQFLDGNNISALFNAYGCNFRDAASDHRYFEAPKGSGKQSSFAGSLWVGGHDQNNTLHMAGQTFLIKGTDYFPGPVSNATGYTNSASWNKVWKITSSQITGFKNWFLNQSSSPNYAIPSAILSWPGNGNTAYGQAAQLAPYVDYNNDGIYNPASGDYPCIKGDMAVFFIMNDDQSSHAETGGLSLKIEIHCMAYSFTSADESINNSIFIDYKIFNRSNTNYDDVYLGTYDDFDIGEFGDDYMGCDIGKNLYYGYNGDNSDSIYGTLIPALGVTYLKTPKAPLNDGKDNDHDGITDESNEELSLSGFYYFGNNSFGAAASMSDPNYAVSYYNYTKGLWINNSHFTCGGNASGGSVNTDYCFPGNSYTLGTCSSNWTDYAFSNTRNDKRALGSCGPLSFPAGEMLELELAYVWAQSLTPTTLSSVNKLGAASVVVHHYYDSIIKPQNCVYSNPTSLIQYNNESTIKLYPNPSSSTVYIDSPDLYTKIEILNEFGNIITTSGAVKEINMEAYASGVYFFKIYTPKGTHFKKVVKI